MLKLTKTGCFISARIDSSRLPQKALLSIRGKKVLEHVIDRAKLVKKADLVVLCTSWRPKDRVLADLAKKQGIKCFRGPLGNMFVRWLGAAEKFGVDYFVTFDGDDLFCEPELMDAALDQVISGEVDFVKIPANLICGASAYAVSRQALKKVCQMDHSKSMEMHRWLTTAMPALFKIKELRVTNPKFFDKKIRLTLDYQEDLDFFKKIFEEFNTNVNNISLEKIVKLISQKPELARINWFRQEDYSKNQKKNMEKFKIS